MIAHLDNYADGELDFITYAELLRSIFLPSGCPMNVCKQCKDSLTGAVACIFVVTFVRKHGTLHLLLHMSLKKKESDHLSLQAMAGLDDIVEDNTMRS